MSSSCISNSQNPNPDMASQNGVSEVTCPSLSQSILARGMEEMEGFDWSILPPWGREGGVEEISPKNRH